MQTAALLALISTAQTIYVAPDGSDRNSGSSSRPFATLEKAVAEASRNDTIVLQEGSYRITRTVTIGQEKNGLTIKGENATLRGAVEVPKAKWHPTGDPRISSNSRPNVYEVDLRGITSLPPLEPRGFAHQGKMAPVELFVGDKPQTLARYPNTGYLKTSRVSGDSFSTTATTRDWSNPDDAWVYGYFKYDWADESIRVQSIRGDTVTLSSRHNYGLDNNRNYYFENVIEELDRPGEYYIDREKAKLFFWPSTTGTAYLSTTDENLIKVFNASSVTIEGITFSTSRAAPVEVYAGRDNTIRKCVFENIGLYALKVSNGSNHRVEQCRFVDLGEGGIQLYGGDRDSLTPANHAIVDCVFENFSRRARTYRPGVDIYGVGMTVKNNEFRDAPHSAIIFHGNDHVIDGNFFHDLLTETGDGGAIYAGRDWSARGTRISNNLFYRLHGERNVENGVYLDDMLSGTLITKNAFVDCRLGLMVGGGRDNVVTQNLFYDCDKAMHLDQRGLGWAKTLDSTLRDSLNKVPYRSDVWRRRYPGIEDILEDEPMSPKNNTVTDNVLLNSGRDTDTLESAFLSKGRVRENASATGSWDIRVDGKTLKIGPRAAAKLTPDMRDLIDQSFGPRTSVPD